MFKALSKPNAVCRKRQNYGEVRKKLHFKEFAFGHFKIEIFL